MRTHTVILGLIIALGLFIAQTSALAQQLLYVDVGATGANNGTTWDDAFDELQDALSDAAGRECSVLPPILEIRQFS